MDIQSSNICEEKNDERKTIDLTATSSSSDDNGNRSLQESDGSLNTEDSSSEEFNEQLKELSRIYFKQVYEVGTDDNNFGTATEELSSDVQLEIIQEENEEIDDESADDDEGKDDDESAYDDEGKNDDESSDDDESVDDDEGKDDDESADDDESKHDDESTDEDKVTEVIIQPPGSDTNEEPRLESVADESNEILPKIEQNTSDSTSGSKYLESDKSPTMTTNKTTMSMNAEDIFGHSDILDDSKETSKILRSVPSDILDKTVLSTPIENINDSYCNDILHNTTENSKLTNETLKEILEDKDTNQTDILDITEANQSLLKNKLKCFKYRGTTNVLNQTDILELTDEIEGDSISGNLDIMDKSEICLGSDNILCDTTKTEGQEELKKTVIAATRLRRSSSLQPTGSPYFPLRRSTRRNSVHSTPGDKEVACETLAVTQLKNTNQKDNDAGLKTTSSATLSKRTHDFNSKTVLPKKRILRSSSIDADIVSSPVTRSRRASSVDEDKKSIAKSHMQLRNNTESPVTKKLPTIEKTSNTKSQKLKTVKSSSSVKKTEKKQLKRAKSGTIDLDKTNLEEYSSKRRLTRRQADLLKKTLNSSELNLGQLGEDQERYRDNESEPLEQGERGPNVEKMDPIYLLNMGTFEGNPDLEEQGNVQHSPSPSIPESPIGSTRKLRSHSSMSNMTSVSDDSYIENKKKSVKEVVGSKTRKQLYGSTDLESKDGPSPPKLRKTRTRVKSESGSDISQISKTQSLIETPKKPVKRTRSSSIHIDSPGVAKSPLRRSERRALLQKSELPKIDEEDSDNKALKRKRDPKTKNLIK